ncbi:thioesterase family protein [Nocardia cerradoensis]|uniref:thioesterase family protein n=1 Tax=Nocardia cerradoensis TaxID=85688 RepID=UPI0003111599|nr:hotdog domain-containing protein [Nocardia cerradoensis]NKY43066.1 thioesterase [Nocardia cerradoensis]
MKVQPGLSAEFRVEVGAADTAVAVGSGDVAVLATPRVVALAEHATVLALRGRLSSAQTSVGIEVSVRHRRPSPPGTVLTVAARLAEVDGPRLAFRVVVHDGDLLVADGTIRRTIVDRASFLARAGER